MAVRDLDQDDLESIAALVGCSRSAANHMLMNRTVRGFARQDSGELAAIVAFDVAPGTVHISTLAGESEWFRELLREPIDFAEREGLAVEMVVPADSREVQQALGSAGFESAAEGPTFKGNETVVFRRV